MAEENILLRVGVDPAQIEQSEKAIISARTEIDRLKESNKQMAAQGQKNSKQYVRNATDIKDLSGVVRDNERVLAANAKMSRSAGGSIAEMRESVKALQFEYINLSKEERENTKIGGELQKRIKGQTDELIDMEKQIGVTGRNVGNYSESIIQAVDSSGLFSKAQQSLAAIQAGVNSSFKGGTAATRGFGLALSATGIGLIIVVIASLVTYLTRTQEGMDFVAKVTAAVGGFMGALYDRLIQLAREIKDNIIPIFKGLGDILGGLATLDFDRVTKGIKGVGDAAGNINGINLIQLGKDAGSAAGEVFKLQGALIEIQKAEARLEAQRSENIAQIEELKRQAKDESLTYQERATALEKATAIEQKQLKQSSDLARQRLSLIKQQNALSESTEADLQRERDVIIEINNLEAASARLRTELNTELQSIRKQQASEQQAAAEREASEQQAASEREALEQQTAEAAVAAQAEANKRFKELTKERLSDTEQAIKAGVDELRRDFADGIIDLATYEAELDKVEALALEVKRASLERQLEQTRENAAIDAETRLALEQDLQSKLRALEDQELAAGVALQKQKIDAERAAAAERASLAQETAEANIAAEDAILQASLNVFGKQSVAGKIAASFQAAIDAIRGANLAMATIPPPFGLIVAAATLASGLANVAKINRKAPPKFAEGGGIEVSGPSHSGGGVPVALGGQTVAEVEGGEGLFVMKKNAFQSLRALSNYNRSFGGKSWTAGGSQYLADGGAVARSGAPAVDRGTIRQAGQDFQDALKELQIVAKISDINRVSNEVKRVEVQGDLS